MAVDLNTLFQATGMTPLAVVPEIKHCQWSQRDILLHPAVLDPGVYATHSHSQLFTAVLLSPAIHSSPGFSAEYKNQCQAV